MKDLKSYFFTYLILMIVLSFGLLGFILLKGHPDIQYKIVVLTTAFYIVWGILHHSFEGDLHFKNVVEYLLIGGLAIVILKILLFRF